MGTGARGAVALALLAGLLAGCTSPSLLDQERVEPYRTLLAAHRNLPATSTRVEVGTPDHEPFRVQVTIIRGGGTGTEPILVFLPGVLADHTTFRFLTGDLARTHDLVLLDHPGTGSSDHVDPAGEAGGRYAPHWLGEIACRALERGLPADLAARPLVLVGHSLGGSVALRMLAHRTEDPDRTALIARFQGAALIAPADADAEDAGEAFRAVADVPDPLFELAHAFGVLRHEVVGGVRDSSYAPHRTALRQEADRIHCLLAKASSRRAARAMLMRFVPMDACRRPLPEAVRAVHASYERVEVPCLVIWGRHDQALPPSMGETIVRHLPQGRLVLVEEARHTVHQEHPGEVAGLIRGFLEGLDAPPPPPGVTTSRTASPDAPSPPR